MSCASITNLSLPNTRIISATEVTSTSGNYCNVIGVINERVSAQDPDHFVYGIGFEVNLPDAWIGRFEMMGGGGTDGSVASPQGSAGTELSQGWAVAADDGGHEDAPGNPAFNWIDDDNNAGGTGHFGLDEQARGLRLQRHRENRGNFEVDNRAVLRARGAVPVPVGLLRRRTRRDGGSAARTRHV
jgi:feruloyl esterase